MWRVDFIIFVVYLLVVARVLYQAYDSLEDRVRIRLDQAALQSHLKANGLDDAVAIGFGFQDSTRYLFNEIPKLVNVNISNKTEKGFIKVDWDRSSLSDAKGRSRRVIHLSGAPIDLTTAQLPTFIAPRGVLQAQITAEELLAREENGSLKATAPIINLKSAASGSFLAGKTPIQFTLWLTLGIPELVNGQVYEHPYSIPCTFLIEKMPWQEYLPFYGK